MVPNLLYEYCSVLDFIRKFISQFNNSAKLEKVSSTVTSKVCEHDSLNPVDITNNSLDSKIVAEVKVTEKIIACDSENIVKNMNEDIVTNTDCKTKDNLHETTIDANKSKDDKSSLNLSFTEQLRNDKSLTIIKISRNVRPTGLGKGNCNETEEKHTQSQNVDIEFVNNGNYKKEKTAAPSFVSQTGNNTNKDFAFNNTSNDVLNSRIANDQQIAGLNEVNTSFSALEKPEKNSEMFSIKDQTIQCLKEFDDVLAEVQGKGDSKLDDAEALSLDEINDILYEELKVNDSTYNFQEIEHTDSLIKKTKIVNESNEIFVGHTLERVITRLHSEIASKITKERGTDVISVSSNDTLSTDVKKPKRLAVTEIKTVEGDTKQIEQYKSAEVTPLGNISKYNDTPKTEATLGIETISISSGDENPDTDDDCGYQSSDFEFITEEEANIDGFIINFNQETSPFDSLIEKHNADDFDRFQDDMFGPGPSSRNVARNDYRSEKQDITDKIDMENYNIPQENELLNMFEGLPTCEVHFLENKSIRTRAPMLVQYEGVGFDMNLFAMQRAESTDDEDQDEAEESLNKILEMYPAENTKTKRRRRH